MNEVRQIALAHAPQRCRAALSALWDLDAALGRVVATTTEPMIGQMRLTWWHDRLKGLDAGAVPAEPVLQALRDVARHHDVTGAMLAGLVEGWEALLEPLPLGDNVLHAYAMHRGDGLFAMSGRIIGRAASSGMGAGWALIDFAMHCSDQVTAARAWAMARDLFDHIDIAGPKQLRILGRIARAKASKPFEEIAMTVSDWTMLRAVLP